MKKLMLTMGLVAIFSVSALAAGGRNDGKRNEYKPVKTERRAPDRGVVREHENQPRMDRYRRNEKFDNDRNRRDNDRSRDRDDHRRYERNWR